MELANALLVGERRKVVTEAQVVDCLNKLSELPIFVEKASVVNYLNSVMAGARI